MPRVIQRTARKDYPAYGIVKGEKHYYWKIKLQRGGIERRSKTYPRPSQLNLGFTGQLGDIQQDISNASDVDELRGLAEAIRELGSEQQDKFDNMPEGLQQGDTGQLLEERAQNLESWADDIETACDAYDSAVGELDEDAEDFEEQREAAFEECRSACEDCPL